MSRTSKPGTSGKPSTSGKTSKTSKTSTEEVPTGSTTGGVGSTPVIHIAALLDGSGSMANLASDVIGGVNTFIEQQRKDGDDALVTIVKFDSAEPFDVIHHAVPIAEVGALTPANYQPRGGTPLFDAIGNLIGLLEQRRASVAPDLRENIVFVIVTDGQENSSREFNLTRIRESIARCEADGWQFVFLSADLNAFEEAGDLGIARGSRKMFHKTGRGTRSAFTEVSTNLQAFREKKRNHEDTDGSRFFEDGSLIIDEFLADDESDDPSV